MPLLSLRCYSGRDCRETCRACTRCFAHPRREILITEPWRMRHRFKHIRSSRAGQSLPFPRGFDRRRRIFAERQARFASLSLVPAPRHAAFSDDTNSQRPRCTAWPDAQHQTGHCVLEQVRTLLNLYGCETPILCLFFRRFFNFFRRTQKALDIFRDV